MGGPKSPYNAQLRAFALLRGKPVPGALRTDWEDMAEYAWFGFVCHFTPAQVEALPFWQRVRYRAFWTEWNRYLRGD